MSNFTYFLSIIVPVYNEKKRFPPYLKEITDYFSNPSKLIELVIVDDGSTDSLIEWIMEQKFPSHIHLNCVSFQENQGKGYAVKKGLDLSQGEFILMADADGAYSISLFDIFIAKALHFSGDLIIPIRDPINKKSPFLRKVASTLFSFLVKILLFPKIQDSQGGFKLFRYDCAKKLAPHITEYGWGFDLELIFWANFYKFNILQVPVPLLRETPGSKIHMLRDSLKMLKTVLKLLLKKYPLCGYTKK